MVDTTGWVPRLPRTKRQETKRLIAADGGASVRATVAPLFLPMVEGDPIALVAGSLAPSNFAYAGFPPGAGITVGTPVVLVNGVPAALGDTPPAGSVVTGQVVVTFTATAPATTVEQVFSLGTRAVAGPVAPPSNWILASGAWSDAGQWDDAANWSDAA